MRLEDLLATGGAEECRKVRDLLKRKLAEMDERLKSMKEFRTSVSASLVSLREPN